MTPIAYSHVINIDLHNDHPLIIATLTGPDNFNWNITQLPTELPEDDFGLVSVTDLPAQRLSWRPGVLGLAPDDIDIEMEP